MTWAPSFIPGSWDAVVVPAALFFSNQPLRQSVNVMVYGPAHLFRAAWLSGAQDYLREPWQPEELILRLRGSQPPYVEWSWHDRLLRLEGLTLALEGGSQVKLSRTEADLLRILVQRRGSVVSRAVLGWAASCSHGRVVDTLVARLRRKMLCLVGGEDNPVPGVRGLGYRLP